MSLAPMAGETFIHPQAVVERGAWLGQGVRIGPFCHVGPDAVLGDRVELLGHVTIAGATTLGADSTVHPQAVLGGPPQNRAHKGGRTTLTIGSGAVIREGVTMHLGSDSSSGETRVGNDGLFMAFSHVGHDCILGHNVTFANLVSLAGHCEIGDFVTMGGHSATHQFVRIGHHAFVGGMTGIERDVIPYGMVIGVRGALRGLNIVGMKRSGMPRSEILALRRAYRTIFDPAAPMTQNIPRALADSEGSAAVAAVVGFLTQREKRSFLVPSRAPGGRPSDDDEA